jgi:uncharacterized cupredoxin-like copper-binding protein
MIATGALAAVALVGCGSSGGGTPYVAPTGPAIKTLTFDADQLAFTPNKVTAPAGILEIKLASQDMTHSLVIEGLPGFQLEAGSGSSATGKVDLKPGKYTFYCDIPGHRAAGMEGTITVS